MSNKKKSEKTSVWQRRFCALGYNERFPRFYVGAKNLNFILRALINAPMKTYKTKLVGTVNW